MATGWASPKKENVNFARLSKLLINGGTSVLRDVFDKIIPPMSLRATLLSTPVHSTLKGLRAKRLLTTQQWNKLYPANKRTPLTSTDFDITLLFVLLRNICGLTPPPTGWDKPPVATDLSREADLARVKYYRNELYGHTTETAVSDSEFEKYWKEISEVLLRLGGPHYQSQIERLKIDGMNPEEEENFLKALKDWEEMERTLLQKVEEVLKIVNGSSVVDDASQAKEYTEKLRGSIKRQTDFLLISEEEDKKIRTDDIFTNVTIARGDKQFKEPKEYRLYGRQNIPRPDEAQASSTKLKTCSEMFVWPENGDQKSTAPVTTNPKSILLTGKAGIGKSLFCQKLVRDWAENTLFKDVQEDGKTPDFQFVVLLTFRQFSKPQKDEGDREQRIDLREMLNRSCILDEHSRIDESLLQYMIENPEKLLIVIDGYDEYTDRKKITGDFETRFPNDPREKIPVPALIAKIMKGKMLKESVVLISSRPGEAEELKNIVFDVRCDIEGFSSPQVMEYIGKYFKDNESMKKRVLDHIKANEILLSFANIPVICFLMCYCINWYMSQAKTTDKLPITKTELYYQVIILFLKKHSSSKYEEMEETKLQELIHKLAEVAMSLTIQGQYVFDQNYLKQFKLDDTEIANLKASGLLDCCAGVRKTPSEKPPLEFTFTHLTIQEFFTSWLLVEKKQIPEKEKTSDVTFMFMAGLCWLKRDEKLMEELMEKIKPMDFDDNRNKLLTLCCLYEYKDSAFSTRFINNHQHRYCNRDGGLRFSYMTDIDCLYISYLLDIIHLINEEQTEVSSLLRHSFITVKGVFIVASSLSASGTRMLCNSLVRISTVIGLWLSSCNLDDECVGMISNVLPRTKITYLHLMDNKITDAGVQRLCSILPGTNITRLDMRVNDITDVGVYSLCSVLSRTNITHIHLARNNISDVGAQCLCRVLESGVCRVKVLDLSDNGKITSGCKKISKKPGP